MRSLDTRSFRYVRFAQLPRLGGRSVSLGQPSTVRGDRIRSSVVRGVTVAALLVLGACSTQPPADSATTSTASSTTFVATTSSSTSTTIPQTTTTVGPAEDVFDVWAAFWDAWKQVRASGDLESGPLERVASPAVVEGAIALFQGERSSGSGPIETEVVLHPKVEDSASDRVVLEDCVLLAPSFTDTAGVWYQADLVRGSEGWVVGDLRVVTTAGCVPREVSDAAIAGYRAYYAAEAGFWDPPDPTSPLIDDVLVDPQRGFIVGLLEEHQTSGVALRGQPATHPEVIEVRSPTELVILSCNQPNPDFGLYDVVTGERLPDEPLIREGQRDLQSAVMILEGGNWKVSDLQGQVELDTHLW